MSKIYVNHYNLKGERIVVEDSRLVINVLEDYFSFMRDEGEWFPDSDGERDLHDLANNLEIQQIVKDELGVDVDPAIEKTFYMVWYRLVSILYLQAQSPYWMVVDETGEEVEVCFDPDTDEDLERFDFNLIQDSNFWDNILEFITIEDEDSIPIKFSLDDNPKIASIVGRLRENEAKVGKQDA